MTSLYKHSFQNEILSGQFDVLPLSIQGSTSAEPVLLIHTSTDQNILLLSLLGKEFAVSIKKKKAMITALMPQY